MQSMFSIHLMEASTPELLTPEMDFPNKMKL